MKYFKTFEEFSGLSPTGIDDVGGEVLPKYNPKIRKEINDYLDGLTPNNKLNIFKWLKWEEPDLEDSDFDEKFEKARKKIVEYFESNPNIKIDSIDIEKFYIPGKSGSVIPRTNNIGGTQRTNNFKLGQ